MKVTCVGTGPAQCLLLRLRQTNVLLDCSVSLPPTLAAAAAALGPGLDGANRPAAAEYRQPNVQCLTPFLELLELQEIHAVLVTTPSGLLGLPYVLRKACELRGASMPRVFCTWAALDMAQHLALDLQTVNQALLDTVYTTTVVTAADSQRCTPNGAASVGSTLATGAETHLPTQTAQGLPDQQEAHAPNPGCWSPPDAGAVGIGQVQDRQQPLYHACWRQLYSAADAEHCWENVTGVRFGQPVQLDGGYCLSATAYPSGSGFGHAIWVLRAGMYTIGYASQLGVPASLSGPAAAPGIAPHAAELAMSRLRGLDCLIMAPYMLHALPQAPSQQQQQQQQHAAMTLVKQAVVQAASTGGNVLIPVDNPGVAWELLDALPGVLESAELGGVLLAAVGPTMRASMALANGSMEFLGSARRNRVYFPADPFAFNDLAKAGRLVVASSLASPVLQERWRQPLVALVPAASLLAGPGQQLLCEWAHDSRNVLLLPEAPHSSHNPVNISAMQEQRASHQKAGLPQRPQDSGSNTYVETVCTLIRHSLHLAAALGDTRGTQPRMRVVAVPLSRPQLAAGAMVQLLQLARPRNLVCSGGDLQALLGVVQPSAGSEIPAGQLQGTQAPEVDASAAAAGALLAEPSGRVVAYSWLQRVSLKLPRGTTCAQLPVALLERLRWVSLGEDHQAARLSCLLVHREGEWHMEQLPRGPSLSTPVGTEASTALAMHGNVSQLHADTLLLGRSQLRSVLAALRARGMNDIVVTMEKVPAGALPPAANRRTSISHGSQGQDAAQGQQQLQPSSEQSVQEAFHIVVQGGGSEVWLGHGWAHIVSSSPVMQRLLAECVTAELAAL